MQLSQLKPFLIALTYIGIIIPYMAFIPFLTKHGLNIQLFIEQATSTRISTFAWLDIIISVLTILLVATSSKLMTFRQATFVILLSLVAGASASLPLLFYFLIASGKLTTTR